MCGRLFGWIRIIVVSAAISTKHELWCLWKHMGGRYQQPACTEVRVENELLWWVSCNRTHLQKHVQFYCDLRVVRRGSYSASSVTYPRNRRWWRCLQIWGDEYALEKSGRGQAGICISIERWAISCRDERVSNSSLRETHSYHASPSPSSPLWGWGRRRELIPEKLLIGICGRWRCRIWVHLSQRRVRDTFISARDDSSLDGYAFPSLPPTKNIFLKFASEGAGRCISIERWTVSRRDARVSNSSLSEMRSYPASPSPSSPFEDEGGYTGDEGVCEGDGLQVSGSSGKIDHLLMNAHPSISAGISAIPICWMCDTTLPAESLTLVSNRLFDINHRWNRKQQSNIDWVDAVHKWNWINGSRKNIVGDY